MAEYCSLKLPEFLKELETFKSGNFEQALKEAFIGFDATLLDDKVIEELRQMARKNPDYEESDMDDDDETAEEIISLHQEATMPLQEVLEKYKGNTDAIAKIQTVQRLMGMTPKQEGESPGPSSSSAGGSSSSSSSRATASGSNSLRIKKSASDNEVSSSSSKPVSDSDADTSEPSSSVGAAPDSTHTIPKATEPEQSTTVCVTPENAPSSANGAVTGSDCTKKSSDDGLISSSSAQENGESNSCPSSSQTTPAADKLPSASPASKVPNQISSSSLPETETDSSSDDENDETYKESPAQKPLNSDDDTTEEEVDPDDEELDEEEEMSGKD